MDTKPTAKLITELQKKLIREETRLTASIKELKDDDPFLNPDHVNDNAAIDTDVREQVGHDTIEAQISSLGVRLGRVQEAIKKIHKNAYGFCENCKKLIGVERLQFIPEARYCIDCERKLVK